MREISVPLQRHPRPYSKYSTSKYELCPSVFILTVDVYRPTNFQCIEGTFLIPNIGADLRTSYHDVVNMNPNTPLYCRIVRLHGQIRPRGVLRYEHHQIRSCDYYSVLIIVNINISDLREDIKFQVKTKMAGGNQFICNFKRTNGAIYFRDIILTQIEINKFCKQIH